MSMPITRRVQAIRLTPGGQGSGSHRRQVVAGTELKQKVDK
jgi:hypothetical protein